VYLNVESSGFCWAKKIQFCRWHDGVKQTQCYKPKDVIAVCLERYTKKFKDGYDYWSQYSQSDNNVEQSGKVSTGHYVLVYIKLNNFIYKRRQLGCLIVYVRQWNLVFVMQYGNVIIGNV
jgi:hypothetical protein